MFPWANAGERDFSSSELSGRITAMEVTRRDNKMKLSDQLRHAVETSGQTRAQISRATGISEPSLSQLMSGKRFLIPTAMDTLAEYLGLELVAKRRPHNRKGK